MKLQRMIMYAGLCVSLSSTISVADILLGRSNATASALPVVGSIDLYDVVARQLVNCCCTVRVYTNSSSDSIRDILIENNNGAPGGGTEDVDDQMSLYISAPGELRASLQAVNSITNGVPAKTRLRIVEFMIDGSVGNPNGTSEIQASLLNTFDIGGDLYAAIIVDNVTGSSTGSGVMNVQIDGDIVRGGIYQNDGVINEIKVGVLGVSGGDVVSELGFAPEFWSSNQINSVIVHGDFEGRIGSNSLGYSGHPNVGSIEVGGDFTGTSPMEMVSLNSFTVGNDFDAEITIQNAMLPGSVYDIGGNFASTASIDLPGQRPCGANHRQL